MSVEIKEWAYQDAKRLQAKADDLNKPVWAAHERACKVAADKGDPAPEPPEMPGEAKVPQFHMSGDRIFEVRSKGASRSDVVDAIKQHVRFNPKPPAPMPDRDADGAW